MKKIFISDERMLFDPFRHTVSYYKQNLLRFTKMVYKGEFEKLFRPGKFLTEPPNNLEKILRFGDANFGGIINATKSR